MKLKENRAFSFAVVAAIYLLVGALAVWLYTLLPFEPWLNVLIADVAATALTFIFSLILLEL